MLAAQAAAYARRGWPVLPLWWPVGDRCACGRPECGSSAGKHPLGRLVPHGLDQATTAQEVIARWWRIYPNANLGLRTGASAGLIVLDVDGDAGAASLRRLIERHGGLDAAWARTGSGGWHAYLAHPGQRLPNSAGRLGKGLDVRGEGGYVVAPPSLHASGRHYRWLAAPPASLPELPAWILEQLTPPSPAARTLRFESGDASAYASAALEREAHAVATAPVGQRNDRLNLAAFRLGRLVGAGLLDEVLATSALLDAARAAGLPEREARPTLASGLAAGVRQPRDIVW